MLELRSHQKDALVKMQNGSLLVGGTGSGKSLVSLVYYYERVVGGSLDSSTPPSSSTPLIVITTAKKRDELDWEREAARFGISTKIESSIRDIRFIVDSWNNLSKYTSTSGAFFIFDEQRAIGYGKWARSFIKIAKRNRWLMLTATPADRWIDLMPVFIAHGFYKHATDFIDQHVEYTPHTTFPKIRRYHDEPHLESLRDRIFVSMPFIKAVKTNVINVKVDYDLEAVSRLIKTEWNPYKDSPIRNLSEFSYTLRRVINSDPSRLDAILKLHSIAERLIVYYNFDYELNILKDGFSAKTVVAEYNGHKHETLPVGDNWVYLLQYTSGSEAWECYTTNHMAFYSQSYSYRVTIQAMGRINRLVSPYTDLYYYRLMSESVLDKSILQAFSKKKNFNERNLYTPRE